MARTKFRAEVLTPEGQVFDDEVEMVSTRTTVGSIGVLANHAPLMAILDPTELRLYKSESDVVRFAQGEGYLQRVDNGALVLVEEAVGPGGLDRAPSRIRAATSFPANPATPASASASRCSTRAGWTIRSTAKTQATMALTKIAATTNQPARCSALRERRMNAAPSGTAVRASPALW